MRCKYSINNPAIAWYSRFHPAVAARTAPNPARRPFAYPRPGSSEYRGGRQFPRLIRQTSAIGPMTSPGRHNAFNRAKQIHLRQRKWAWRYGTAPAGSSGNVSGKTSGWRISPQVESGRRAKRLLRTDR